MMLKVIYIGRQLIELPIEGYHIASDRIINAAFFSKINLYPITIEKKISDETVSDRYMVVKSLIEPKIFTSFFPSLFWSFNDLLITLKILFKIKPLNFDLIHVLNINKEAYLLSHFLTQIKKPFLLHLFHSPYVLNDDVFKFRKILFRLGFYQGFLSSYILTINNSMYDYLVNKIGINKSRVYYIPMPIDVNKFKPLNKEDLCKKYGLPRNGPIIVYVGSLNPSRGLFYLLKSFMYVSNKFPNAILFISYLQRKGEKLYENHLKKYVELSGLKNQIILFGPSKNVEEIYNLADVVVLPFTRPYWFDPPLVLLEAMSSGSAIVTTSVGSISEVVKNYMNGILVQPNDSVLLADMIIYLLENPSESYKIARNARKTIVDNYSYEKIGNRLENIYDDIINIS